MPLEDEFGDVIGKARRGHGLSPTAVASAVGVTEDALAAMESYERLPTRDEVERFARALRAARRPPLGHCDRGVGCPAGTTDNRPAGLAPDRVCDAAVSGALLPGGGSGRLVPRHRHRDGGRPAARQATRDGLAGGGHPHHGHGHGDRGAHRRPDRGPAATAAPVYIGAADASAAAHVPSDAVHRLDADRQLSWGSLAAQAIPYARSHARQRQLPDRRNGVAFVGDTMFAGSAGGTRSPAAYQDILRSVRERLLRLPPETPVFPAHGPATTIANEQHATPSPRPRLTPGPPPQRGDRRAHCSCLSPPSYLSTWAHPWDLAPVTSRHSLQGRSRVHPRPPLRILERGPGGWATGTTPGAALARHRVRPTPPCTPVVPRPCKLSPRRLTDARPGAQVAPAGSGLILPAISGGIPPS